MNARSGRIRVALPLAAIAVAAIAVVAVAVVAVLASRTPGEPPPASAEPGQVSYALTLSQPASGGVLDHIPKREAYAEHERVVVRARHNTGYELTGWGGDCAHVPASTDWCVLTMDADKTVSTTFGAVAASEPLSLIVVSDGSHDSLLLEWTGGPSNATKWQYRKRQWKKGFPGEWGSWSDIPGSGVATRSYKDTGLPALSGWDYQVRAVVGTVAAEASEPDTNGTQKRDAGPLDMYHSRVVEGDGRQRWIVVGFTIVIPDGVRARVYSPIQPSGGGQRGTPVSVYGAGRFLFGPHGEVYRRDVPPAEDFPNAAQAQAAATVLDAIIDSIRPYRVTD